MLVGLAAAPGPIWGYLGRLGLILGLGCLLGWLLAGRARPEAVVHTERPEAGDFVELEAIWRGLWPGFWRVTIEDRDAAHRHEGWFGIGRQHLRWVERDVRRGLHVFDVSLGYRDPLGLFARTLPHRARLAVAVRPRAVVLASRPLARSGDESLRGVLRASEQQEFAGVRRYEAGDRLAQLHWPQTVRTGRLQVRQTLRSGARVREILLDTDRSDYPDAALFELAVSVAASFALTFARTGQQVALAAGAQFVSAGQGRGERLMEALTAVELGRRALPRSGGRHVLLVGPGPAAAAFKQRNPGAVVVAVGESPAGPDLTVPNFPALWRLGRRIRP